MRDMAEVVILLDIGDREKSAASRVKYADGGHFWPVWKSLACVDIIVLSSPIREGIYEMKCSLAQSGT